MQTALTFDEYVVEIARLHEKTTGQMMEWLNQQKLIIKPCDCGENGCEGWKTVSMWDVPL